MGACMAISDAAMLDRLLAERPTVADALGDYEAAMRQGDEAGVRHARRAARMSQAGNPIIARMRDALLAHTPPERVHAIAADMVAGR
jgi:2-polyprenyl-6-methoxyphenol hydroxylase-like FAD-dependent oxidoreductase